LGHGFIPKRGLPPPDPNVANFQASIASLGNYAHKSLPTIFVKKMELIPEFKLLVATSRHMALALADRGLIGQFTGIWPSPKSMDLWMKKNWAAMIKGKLTYSFCGRGFYAFLFELKEDHDLIFRNGP